MFRYYRKNLEAEAIQFKSGENDEKIANFISDRRGTYVIQDGTNIEFLDENHLFHRVLRDNQWLVYDVDGLHVFTHDAFIERYSRLGKEE